MRPRLLWTPNQRREEYIQMHFRRVGILLVSSTPVSSCHHSFGVTFEERANRMKVFDGPGIDVLLGLAWIVGRVQPVLVLRHARVAAAVEEQGLEPRSPRSAKVRLLPGREK